MCRQATNKKITNYIAFNALARVCVGVCMCVDNSRTYACSVRRLLGRYYNEQF